MEPKMKFGLMLFASSEDTLDGDKYHLAIESARFGDRHGFSSIWVPERHFTRFGALYPNPAVLHSALAMTTQRIRLNAGSVVTPIHNPIRIAEEWAVVDNISHGRVGISFASGWNPDDFAFFPERYANRHEEMYKGINEVRRLWRGETASVTSGNGKSAEVRIYPTPVQKELPVCLTAAGNPKTYKAAGQMGANLLTHILDQEIEQLAEKIALYRRARDESGFDPASGQVTLMLHTFVGADVELVREQARRPYCEYLKSNIGLLGGVAESRGRKIDLARLSDSHLDEFVNYLYDRFASRRGLIGTPESCLELIRQFEQAGVDEIACLLDFGPDRELILDYLPHLNRLKNLYTARYEQRRFANGSKVSVDEIRARCVHELSGAQFHEMIESYGIRISSPIRFVEHVWRRDGEALAQLQLSNQYASNGGYHIHPAALDACGRVMAAAMPESLLKGSGADLYLPAGMGSFRLHRSLAGTVWSHAILKSPLDESPNQLLGDVFVYDTQDNLLLEIRNLKLKRAHTEAGKSIEHIPHSFDRLLYGRVWKPFVITNTNLRKLPVERWILFADRLGVAKRLAERLTVEGHDCIFVDQSLNAEAIERLINDAIDNGSMICNVVYLWSLDATPSARLTCEALVADQEQTIKGALHLVQSLAHRAKDARVRTCFVTQGAVSISSEKDALSVAQAPVWGFARAVSVEHPNLWGGLIDLDPAESIDESGAVLAQALSLDHNEDMLCVRAGEHYVARLEPEKQPKSETLIRFSEDATYLITGALGGLGRRLALWMAERGAHHLCLVSRSANEDRAAGLLAELNSRGVEALVMSADVAREEDVSMILRRIKESMPTLRGIFHLAGSLDDALLVNESWERFTKVRAAKVEGAWNLHHLTTDSKLDYFIMFSSAASLLMTSGQANYAMANTFLDALAHYRRSLGLPALSVNWGPWADAGHAETEYGREAHSKLRSFGVSPIRPDQGLELLGILMSSDQAQIAAIDIDWASLFQNDPAASRLAMFSELAEKYSLLTDNSDNKEADTEILQALRELPENERRRYLMNFLSEKIVQTLKLDADFALEPRQKLFDLGFDSIMAIEFKNRLERSLGRSFSATLLFMHPTLEALTNYLLIETIGASTGGEAKPAVERADKVESIEVLSEEQMVDLLMREIEAGRP